MVRRRDESDGPIVEGVRVPEEEIAGWSGSDDGEEGSKGKEGHG